MDLARALAAEIDGAQPVVDSNTPPLQIEHWRMLLEDALGVAVATLRGANPGNWGADEWRTFGLIVGDATRRARRRGRDPVARSSHKRGLGRPDPGTPGEAAAWHRAR